jgi:hypothetical protein
MADKGRPTVPPGQGMMFGSCPWVRLRLAIIFGVLVFLAFAIPTFWGVFHFGSWVLSLQDPNALDNLHPDAATWGEVVAMAGLLGGIVSMLLVGAEIGQRVDKAMSEIKTEAQADRLTPR